MLPTASPIGRHARRRAAQSPVEPTPGSAGSFTSRTSQSFTTSLPPSETRVTRVLPSAEKVAAATTKTKDIRPGMRLAREFGGKVHVVTIGNGGEILWNERKWRSLSEVARAITGTRWSGPAFFGLREKRKAA